MYQLICQLPNQISNNVQTDRPFITYINYVSVNEVYVATNHLSIIWYQTMYKLK